MPSYALPLSNCLKPIVGCSFIRGEKGICSILFNFVSIQANFKLSFSLCPFASQPVADRQNRAKTIRSILVLESIIVDYRAKSFCRKRSWLATTTYLRDQIDRLVCQPVEARARFTQYHCLMIVITFIP